VRKHSPLQYCVEDYIGGYIEHYAEFKRRVKASENPPPENAQ